MTPHIHRDVIIAWANGAQIQRKRYNTTTWEDVTYPSWLDQQYRIKPETIKYKRFLCRLGNSHEVVVVTPDRQATDPRQTWGSFVKWIDKDWQEVEV